MQSSSGSTSTTTITRHIPVLLQEVLDVLEIHENDVVLDGTLGGGGHARAFADRLGEDGHLIGFDVDSGALARAREKLADTKPQRTFVHDNFRNVSAKLAEYKIDGIDKALFDLGWSSDQLEVSGRGFSFERDEPLQMTLSDDVDEDTLTASEIVNYWEEENIADILYGWGGERFSRRIARGIVAARKEGAIETTEQLVEIVRRAMPAQYRYGKRNPATKTFQALRIAVNDELGALKSVLEALPNITHANARVAFLTFHSLEDKLVKETFRGWAKEGLGELASKKPIPPTREEVGQNRRARSAKLRAFIFN
ncbi:16S rRNA (cytosine(1402)-N(4))-methyltransferase [Candidatus Kaiserbacteria bacterium]|nr:MAG: 16S rRNA (cytosine(1402)-N(4))-methyltransferase [Candidatus Kaiserbacteria bacterium]